MVLPLMHISGLLYGKTTNEGAGRLAVRSSARSHLY